MAKTFATMKTNVGNIVQDTSTEFATLIGVWLNDKYLDIARRMMWSVLIDNNYTIAVTSAAASYTLPTDFEEEIGAFNITDGYKLTRYPEGKWWADRGTAYNAGTISAGTPINYIIEKEAGKIRLDPSPQSTFTLGFPYKKTITALSGSTDAPLIMDIEAIMESGASAESFAYQRQFGKADAFMQKYEFELLRRIGQERSAINQNYQWIPQGDTSSGVRPLTGWASYDTV